jgi:hypothetical protein
MAAGNGWDSGLKAMWSSAVVKAAVGYVVFVGPLLLVVLITYDNVARGRTNRFEIQVSLLILLIGLALLILFQPWRRALWDLVKARKWQLGVWRDSRFASSRTSEAALKERARSLDTEQLLACHKWPDHTASAGAVIRKELQSRRLTAEAIDGWLPPASNITVPPRTPSDLRDRWQSLEALAFALARFLAFVGLAGLIVFLLFAPFEISTRTNTGVIPIAFGALVYGWGALLVIVIPVGTLIRLLTPTRILLLRPFDQRSMTRTLKRVVLNYVGSFGHVYTLSDIHYRPNPLLRLGDMIATGVRYAIAVLLRPSIRVATVKNARTYLALAGRLEGGLKPAFRHFISGGQAYNIKSTDRWWQWCIDLLMHSSNAVVMDISRVSTGSAWEIEHIDVRDTLSRTIFIAQEAHEKHGSEALQRLLGDAQLPPIFLYTAAGEFKEPGAFRQALAAKLEGRPTELPKPVTTQPAATIEPRAEVVSPEPVRVEPMPQAAARVEPMPQAVEPIPHAPLRAEPVPQAFVRTEPVRQAPARIAPMREAPTAAGKIMGLSPMAVAFIAAALVLGAAVGWPLLRDDAGPAPDSAAVQPMSRCAAAKAHWDIIEMSNALPSFEDHLSRFPECEFANLAQQKIEFLKDCETSQSEARRLYDASIREEDAGSLASGVLSIKPGDFRPRDPKVCEHMERAVRYSDEMKRFVERKKETCTHVLFFVLVHDANVARDHIGRYCRGPAPKATPAPTKGKPKEIRPRPNTK